MLQLYLHLLEPHLMCNQPLELQQNLKNLHKRNLLIVAHHQPKYPPLEHQLNHDKPLTQQHLHLTHQR